MPKTNYVCEFCGENFKEDRNACLTHENTAHVEPNKYNEIGTVYYGGLSKYPSSVKLTMKDGVVIQYDFFGEIKESEQKKAPPLLVVVRRAETRKHL